MKKFLAIIVCLILSLGVFVGCGRPADDIEGIESNTVSLNVDKDVKASFSILIPSGNINETTMIRCLIDDFKEMYPNVEIKLSNISVQSYQSSIRNLEGAGTLDDIIWSNSPDYYFLVANKLVKNLNPYIEESEKAGIFNVEEDFYSEFIECGKIDGNLYCMPRSADSVVTFINTDMFKKAGVDMSKVKNGWTWQDFMDTCATLRAYFDSSEDAQVRARYVIDANLTNWLSVCWPMLSSYGAEVIDANGNVAIESDATKKCLAMVQEMVEKRYINASGVSSGSSYETGTSPMMFQSASVSLFADRKALKDKVDIVSFPLITDNNTPKIGSGIAGYCINRKAKNPDLCWKFLDYMISYEGQQRMGENGLNLASLRKDLADYTTANWGKKYSNLNLSAYLYGSEYKIDTKFLTRTNIKYQADITEAITSLFNDALTAKFMNNVDECIRRAKNSLSDAMYD